MKISRVRGLFLGSFSLSLMGCAVFRPPPGARAADMRWGGGNSVPDLYDPQEQMYERHGASSKAAEATAATDANLAASLQNSNTASLHQSP